MNFSPFFYSDHRDSRGNADARFEQGSRGGAEDDLPLQRGAGDESADTLCRRQ